MPTVHRWTSLPVDAWPRCDYEAWQATRRPGGPLEQGGAAARLGSETLASMQRLYGQFLNWLSERGDLNPQEGPAARMTHDRFVNFLAERRTAVSANTVFNNLRMLAMMLGVLAPDAEWGWLYRHPHAPRRHEAAVSRRPVPIVQPGRLLVGLRTAMDAVLLEPMTQVTARRLRDLLIVAITTTTALRRRNIIALTIGDTFLRHRYGYEIRFPASAVKNARAISMVVMSEMTHSLDRYLESYRPMLLAGREDTSRALWVTSMTQHFASNSMNAAFRRITVEILGYEVNPHSLRHTAATTILTRDPMATGIASASLAHGNEATLDRFYDLSGDAATQALWRKLSLKYRRPANEGSRSGRPRDANHNRPHVDDDDDDVAP